MSLNATLIALLSPTCKRCAREQGKCRTHQDICELHGNDPMQCRACLILVYCELITRYPVVTCRVCEKRPRHPLVGSTCIDLACLATIPCMGAPWQGPCGEPSVNLAGRCQSCTDVNHGMVKRFEQAYA